MPSPRAGRPCLYLRTPSPARALGRQIFTVWYGSHCDLPALTVKLKNRTQWCWAEYWLYVSCSSTLGWRMPPCFTSRICFPLIYSRFQCSWRAFNVQLPAVKRKHHSLASPCTRIVAKRGVLWVAERLLRSMLGVSCKSSTPHSQMSFGRLF